MFKKLGSAIGTVFGFILVLAFVVLMADSNAEAPNYKSVVYAQEKAIIYSEPVKPWEPPSIGGKTLVVTYGRIGSGSWGTLGAANTPEAAVDLAIQYANQVDLWNGSKGVVAVVNPNLSDYGGNEPEESFVNKLIAVARDKKRLRNARCSARHQRTRSIFFVVSLIFTPMRTFGSTGTWSIQ